MPQASKRSTKHSIIALDQFIQATRDSGYKGTASAVAELVDNAIQATANEIAITVEEAGRDRSIDLSVLDNGCGMDPFTLRQALRFGGSTRFGSRDGLGRYGMGLPNSSLSQAPRVTVFTWNTPSARRRRPSRNSLRNGRPAKQVYSSYLDLEEIVRGQLEEVPRPKLTKRAPDVCRGSSGTLVRWTRCDRLDNRRVSTITRKLSTDLGRRFRHFIWGGLRITVNGEVVKAIDPLYLHRQAIVSGAHQFGEVIRYEVVAHPGNGQKETGWIEVCFSELPVCEWYKLSNDEKARIGISKGAGVSIVRAGREVDYGWFFMGGKRRENYDDWWRCEIRFDPKLDEAFGITHTKQQVRPKPYVLEILTPDIEATARALNNRARKSHLAAKAGERFSQAEMTASLQEHLLKPLPSKANKKARALMTALKKRHPALRRLTKDKRSRYRIIEAKLRDTSFFSYALDQEELVLVLNPDHPFYREIYKPLVEGDSPQDQQLRAKLELLLLAAARSEASHGGGQLADALSRQRVEWSDTLAAFLNG